MRYCNLRLGWAWEVSEGRAILPGEAKTTFPRKNPLPETQLRRLPGSSALSAVFTATCFVEKTMNNSEEFRRQCEARYCLKMTTERRQAHYQGVKENRGQKGLDDLIAE